MQVVGCTCVGVAGALPASRSSIGMATVSARGPGGGHLCSEVGTETCVETLGGVVVQSNTPEDREVITGGESSDSAHQLTAHSLATVAGAEVQVVEREDVTAAPQVEVPNGGRVAYDLALRFCYEHRDVGARKDYLPAVGGDGDVLKGLLLLGKFPDHLIKRTRATGRRFSNGTVILSYSPSGLRRPAAAPVSKMWNLWWPSSLSHNCYAMTFTVRRSTASTIWSPNLDQSSWVATFVRKSVSSAATPPV